MSWGLWGIGVPGPGERTAAHPSTYEADHPLGQIAANHPNVDLHAWESPQGIKVNMIQVAPEHQGKGYAGAALRDLISYADAQGLPIALTPGIPEGRRGMSQAALKRWYSSHGFVPNKGRNKDWNWAESMIRPARAHRTAESHPRDEWGNRVYPKDQYGNPNYGDDHELDEFMYGQCAAYACGHHREFPHLRFGIDWENIDNTHDDWDQIMGEDEGLDPDDPAHQDKVFRRPQHIFTHDDHWAYDASGAYSLNKIQRWHDLTLNHSLKDVENTGYLESGYIPEPDYVRKNPPRSAPPPHTAHRTAMPTYDPTAPFGVPGPGERTAGANGDLPEGMVITHRNYPRSGESSWHAHHNGEEIGSLYVMPSDYSDRGAVGDISVHDDYLRRGVATALWEAAGRPLHTPGQQTGKGQAWAQAVGGDNDPDPAWNPDDDAYDFSDHDEDEDYDDGDSPFYTSAARTAMPVLYRGLQREFDPDRPATPIGAPNGYSHWTDSPDIARQWAGPEGHVYSYDLPDEAMGSKWINENADGKTPLYFDNGPLIGRPGAPKLKGREYLVYNDHDDYDPTQIKPYKKARTMTAAVTVPVGSQHGLHTTPSMLISNAVKRTGWPVWFSDETGTRIDARDPLAVMSLGARHGAPITVHCDHPEIAAHIADYVAQDHD